MRVKVYQWAVEKLKLESEVAVGSWKWKLEVEVGSWSCMDDVSRVWRVSGSELGARTSMIVTVVPKL